MHDSFGNISKMSQNQRPYRFSSMSSSESFQKGYKKRWWKNHVFLLIVLLFLILQRETEIFYLLSHSLNAFNRHNWADTKLRTRNWVLIFSRIFHLPPMVYTIRNLKSKARAGNQAQLLPCGIQGVLTCILPSRLNVITFFYKPFDASWNSLVFFFSFYI